MRIVTLEISPCLFDVKTENKYEKTKINQEHYEVYRMDDI